MTVHGEIKKRRDEVIVIDTHNYKGIPVLDIRIFIIRRNGRKIPTKKGITINIEKLDELKTILSTIND
jgi:hypothetical protein